MRDVVEVVATFGETVIDVALAERYVIGDSPVAAIPIAGVAPVVVVDGFTFRDADGTATALVRDRPMCARIGGVEARVTRIARPPSEVLQARPDVRVWAYLAGSVLAHAAVWMAATWRAPVESERPDGGASRPRLVANISSAPRAVRQPVEAPRVEIEDRETDDEAAPKRELELPSLRAHDGAVPVAWAIEDADRDLELPAARQDPAPSRHPEPCSGMECGIVETGHYRTAPSKRGAGEEYELAPRRSVATSVVDCRVGSRCSTVTGADQTELRRAIEDRLGAIDDCFAGAQRSVVLELELEPDGTLHRAVPATDAVGDCIVGALAASTVAKPRGGEPQSVTLAFARD